jgi:hypothetical protein
MVIEWLELSQRPCSEATSDKILSREAAAIKVGATKKSLDDYLLHIRFARKYGFSFKDHVNQPMGILRKFVKKMKKLERSEVKSPKLSSHKSQSEDEISFFKSFLQ